MLRRLHCLLGAELRLHIGWPLVSALAMLGTIWLVFGINPSDEKTILHISQRLLPYCGLFLMVPVLLPEQIPAVKALVLMKKGAIESIFSLRLVCRSLIFILMTGLYLFGLTRGKSPDFFELSLSTFLIGWTLSGLGLLIYSLGQNIISSYLVPSFVLIIQWFGIPVDLKVLDITHWIDNPWFLFSLGLVLFSLSLFLWKRYSFTPNN